MTTSFIYWLTRLDHLHAVIETIAEISAIIAVLVGGTALLCFIFHFFEDNEDVANGLRKIHSYGIKISICLLICCICLNCAKVFMPTTKEMAAIYVVPKIANSESINEIESELMTLARERLNELHPSKIVNNTQKGTK